MEVIEWIRFIVGAIFLLVGLGIFVLEVFGVFRFRYALNRMHVAAMGDTLGIGSALLGLVIMCGFHMESCKIIMIVMFFWIASPVCSHMLSKLEVATNEHLSDHCTRWDDLLSLEKEIEKDHEESRAVEKQECKESKGDTLC